MPRIRHRHTRRQSNGHRHRVGRRHVDARPNTSTQVKRLLSHFSTRHQMRRQRTGPNRPNTSRNMDHKQYRPWRRRTGHLSNRTNGHQNRATGPTSTKGRRRPQRGRARTGRHRTVHHAIPTTIRMVRDSGYNRHTMTSQHRARTHARQHGPPRRHPGQRTLTTRRQRQQFITGRRRHTRYRRQRSGPRTFGAMLNSRRRTRQHAGNSNTVKHSTIPQSQAHNILNTRLTRTPASNTSTGRTLNSPRRRPTNSRSWRARRQGTLRRNQGRNRRTTRRGSQRTVRGHPFNTSTIQRTPNRQTTRRNNRMLRTSNRPNGSHTRARLFISVPQRRHGQRASTRGHGGNVRGSKGSLRNSHRKTLQKRLLHERMNSFTNNNKEPTS